MSVQHKRLQQQVDQLRAELAAARNALAADNARLRKIGLKMRAAISGAWSADRMTSVGDALRPVIQDPECDRDSFFAPPAQSLAAHDSAVKVAVLLAVAEKLRLEESTNSSMHAEFVEAEADRIEKEAQRG